MGRIAATLEALARDPFPAASRNRAEHVGPGYRSLHLGRRARHFVLYRAEEDRILVVRILHDQMDAARHVPPSDD